MIRLWSSSEYRQETASPETSFSKIILVLDEVGMICGEMRESLRRILSLKDEEELQRLLALQQVLVPSLDEPSSVNAVFYSKTGEIVSVVVGLLPTACSRHNTPSRSHSVSKLVKANVGTENCIIVLFSSSNERVYAQTIAAARQFPSYRCSKQFNQRVDLVVHFPEQHADNEKILKEAQSTLENIRLAQHLVDSPPNLLHSDALVTACEEVALKLACGIQVIRGEELRARGFGGIYGVGKAAEHPPALVILSHFPATASPSTPAISLVGKGIVYDTGGLSIKTPSSIMVEMKTDMAGSAAVLGAFATAVAVGGLNRPLHALLCIAENAVGPLATRPDDIHLLLSGKTVEINDTDAEGRLVLSDGVFFAADQLASSVIIDIATLTGAQGIATGQRHGVVYCNSDTLEALAIAAGKFTGDLVFPIPYCPEFYRQELQSEVADMKNSAKDRANALASCAGQFIGNHLETFLSRGGQWMHLDMGFPAVSQERATGYGVALLFKMVQQLNK